MVNYRLTRGEQTQLRAAHRHARDQREADQIKAVVLIPSGRRAEGMADALLVDPTTLRTQFKRYRAGGLAEFLKVAYRGGDAQLGDAQFVRLGLYLQEPLYLSPKDIAACFEAEFKVSYAPSGMAALPHRPGVVYEDTINAESTIAFFDRLLRVYTYATGIYVICHNARDYRSKAVQEYVKKSRINLVFLPPYARL
jgi:transposase